MVINGGEVGESGDVRVWARTYNPGASVLQAEDGSKEQGLGALLSHTFV